MAQIDIQRVVIDGADNCLRVVDVVGIVPSNSVSQPMRTDRAILLVICTAIVSLIIGSRLPRLMWLYHVHAMTPNHDSLPQCGKCKDRGKLVSGELCTCPMGERLRRGIPREGVTVPAMR